MKLKIDEVWKRPLAVFAICFVMGELNGGCTAADGCREQPLLAAILQEGNVRR